MQVIQIEQLEDSNVGKEEGVEEEQAKLGHLEARYEE